MRLFRRSVASTRRRLVRSYVHTMDFLETRQLMAAGPLGVNVTSTLDFVDVMKEAEAWGQEGTTPLTQDAQGWPTSDAQVLVFDERVNQPWNGPDASAVNPDIGGTYHLSFSGQATLSPGWLTNYTVQNQVYNPKNNTTTADLVVQHNSQPMLYINFINTIDPASATGAGVSNVKLIQPGYAANTTQVFATNYLNALAPFGTIRYLNVDDANNYGLSWDSTGKIASVTPLQWSQRTLPSDASQSQTVGGTVGIAWEYMIALANSTNTDMWINIPGPATDDYVSQLANLIKNGDTVNGVNYAGLNSNLKVYIEYSNEVWGGIYNPYSVNQQLTRDEVAAGGSVLNNDGTTDTYTLAGRRYLERTMQLTNIFRSVMGNDPSYSKIRPVLGWQEGNWQYYQQTLPWFESTYGAPSNYFYGMGYANYPSVTPDYSSLNEIFAALATAETVEYATTVNFTTLSTFYGLKTVAYEGGPGIGTTQSSTAEANSLAATRDPRMEQVVDQMYTNWYAAGGDVADFFDGPFDTLSPGNDWALIELADESTPTHSPKFRGVYDLAASPNVAVTAGNPVAPSVKTSLSLTSDSLGGSFTYPKPGQTNDWLLNVATAGNYVLTLTTQSNGSLAARPGAVQVYLGDRQLIGTFSVISNGTVSLGTLKLPAGLSTIVIKTVDVPGVPSGAGTYPFQPVNLLLSPQVVYSTVGSTGYSETGQWTKGQGYDAASAGNGTATASWTFNVAPGTYEVSTTWPSSSTNSTAATYQVSQGAVGGAASTAASSLTVGDPSFEAVPVGSGGYSAFSYDPTGSSWAFTGQAGISGNGSGFTGGNPAAPQGSQVAILQSQGSFTQTVANLAAGTYQIGFLAAQRGNVASNEDFQVLVDGLSQGTIRPTGASYQGYTTSAFTVSTGIHTIEFIGLDSSGGDNTALIDGVSLSRSTLGVGSGSPILGTISVNQAQLPVGFLDAGLVWQDLSGTYTVTGTTLTVTLSNSPLGLVDAMSIRLKKLS